MEIILDLASPHSVLKFGAGSVQLKSIGEIRSGFQFRGAVRPDPNGTVSLIQVKDIDDEHQLVTDDLITIRFDKDLEAYRVTQGDVLFLSRGHHLCATPINEPLESTIATSYFYVLRPDPLKVLPEYLAWYLNQRPFQERMKLFVQGSVTPMISRRDFEKLKIEIPSVQTQRSIVDLDNLARRERALLSRLMAKRAELVRGISMKLATGQIKEKEGNP